MSLQVENKPTVAKAPLQSLQFDPETSLVWVSSCHSCPGALSPGTCAALGSIVSCWAELIQDQHY